MIAIPPFELFFADDQAVVLRANLVNGWARLGDTYGFERWERLPFREGTSIRGHLKVYAGKRCANRATQFPEISANGGSELFEYLLTNRQFEIKVRLNPQGVQVGEGGRPRIRVMEQRFIRVDRGLYFSFCCWTTFYELQPAPIPDVKEWCQKMFLHGGRPESNRRRF